LNNAASERYLLQGLQFIRILRVGGLKMFLKDGFTSPNNRGNNKQLAIRVVYVKQ